MQDDHVHCKMMMMMTSPCPIESFCCRSMPHLERSDREIFRVGEGGWVGGFVINGHPFNCKMEIPEYSLGENGESSRLASTNLSPTTSEFSSKFPELYRYEKRLLTRSKTTVMDKERH